jgi:hypothetical protein
VGARRLTHNLNYVSKERLMKKIYANILTGTGEIESVECKMVSVGTPKIKTFIHHTWSNKSSWTVSEWKTGRAMGHGRTQKEAIADARSKIFGKKTKNELIAFIESDVIQHGRTVNENES